MVLAGDGGLVCLGVDSSVGCWERGVLQGRRLGHVKMVKVVETPVMTPEWLRGVAPWEAMAMMEGEVPSTLPICWLVSAEERYGVTIWSGSHGRRAWYA